MSRLPLYGGIVLVLAATVVGVWYSKSRLGSPLTDSRPVFSAPPNVKQSLEVRASVVKKNASSAPDVLSPSELLKQRDAQQTTLLSDEQINEVVNSMERLPYDQVIADVTGAEKKTFEKFIDPMPPELVEAMEQPTPPPLNEAQIQEAVNATNLRYD